MPDLSIRRYDDCDNATLQTEIIPCHRPAILKGFVKDWPAVDKGQQSEKALYDYLTAQYAQRSAQAKVVTYQGPADIGGRMFYNDDMTGFNFERKTEDFDQCLSRIFQYYDEERPPVLYAGGVDLNENLPKFLEDNAFNLLAEEPTLSPKIWVGNSAKVATHYDVQDNIACLVNNFRRFTLFPPEQVENLYIGPLDVTLSGTPVSMVDVSAPDFDKFPKFARALEHAITVDLEPGDALYIPSLWWHNVESQGKFNLLVNFWWNNAKPVLDSPFDCMLHGIFSISHLPEKERLAWKSFFDHFIFKVNGDPSEHLKGREKTILGPISPAIYKKVKTYVLKMLMEK